mmetsp:Transcript_30174/g.97025  ORF Transcript_30174/g.97025 Transcript_30174/m.97025 type:complete len:361 (+) Transcript_30174:170-1252(+)
MGPTDLSRPEPSRRSGRSIKRPRLMDDFALEDHASSPTHEFASPGRLPATSVVVSNANCAGCGDGDDVQGNEILLCDGPGCGAAYHLKCLPRPLAVIPPGDWFCPACQPMPVVAAVVEAWEDDGDVELVEAVEAEEDELRMPADSALAATPPSRPAAPSPPRTAHAAARAAGRCDHLMDEAEARRMAAEEGLTLVHSPRNQTGFMGVARTESGRFRSKLGEESIGTAATAEAAALLYARRLGPETSAEAAAIAAAAAASAAASAAAAEAEPMSAAEAERLAAVEGLTLVPSTGSLDGRKAGSVSKWGFKGVSYKAKIGMFHAALGTESIGSFRSAPEAALAYARRLGPEGSAESARRALA